MITRYDHYEFQGLSLVRRQQKILEYLADVHENYGMPIEEIKLQYEAAIVVMDAKPGYWT